MTQLSKYEDFLKSQSRMKELGMDLTKIKKEISFACQVINGSKQLTETTIESRMKAVINIANVGLTLNPIAKEAYLIARYNKSTGQKDCDLEVSYLGMTKLIFQEGIVQAINTQVVHENDTIEVESLAEGKIIHKPVFKDRGSVIGVYSIATFSGMKQAEMMTLEDLNSIRDKSEGYQAFKAEKIKQNPWNEWYGEMCRKSNIRRFIKYLPRGNNQDLLNAAIEIDNRDYQATYKKIGYIEGLLNTSAYGEAERQAIENALLTMTDERADQIIEDLKANQLNPVTQGSAFSTTDAQKQIDLHE